MAPRDAREQEAAEDSQGKYPGRAPSQGLACGRRLLELCPERGERTEGERVLRERRQGKGFFPIARGFLNRILDRARQAKLARGGSRQGVPDQREDQDRRSQALKAYSHREARTRGRAGHARVRRVHKVYGVS